MELLKGGALLALVASFWGSIKQILWTILSTFIQKVEITTEDVHNEVIGHLVENFKLFKGYDITFGSQYESFRNGKYGLVPYEKFGESFMIFLSKKKYFFKLIRMPFIFSKNDLAVGSSKASGEKDETKKSFSFIISLRGSINISKMIQNSISKRNKLSWDIEDAEGGSNRFNIYYFPEREKKNKDEKHSYGFGYSWFKQNHYRLLGVSQNQLGRELKNKGNALENLFFPEEVKKLIEIVRLWVKSKKWYMEKSIPWKRGWLLYGPPGTGKTALARAFAEDLNLPIYLFNLAQMTNEGLIKAWQSMQLNVPCIALIEDIDNVFDKRKNIVQFSSFGIKGLLNNNSTNPDKDGSNSMVMPLTFDTLLNCIDGIDKTDGVFTIITTNDLTKIDDAIGVPKALDDGSFEFLSTRPGRVDRAISLTYMNKENKIEMAQSILSDFPHKLNELKIHISKNIKETPAQFQEYCSQIALTEYWKTQEESNSDDSTFSNNIKKAI